MATDSAHDLRTPSLSTALLISFSSPRSRSVQSFILTRAQGSGGRDAPGQGVMALGQGGGLAVGMSFVFCFLSVFFLLFIVLTFVFFSSGSERVLSLVLWGGCLASPG